MININKSILESVFLYFKIPKEIIEYIPIVEFKGDFAPSVFNEDKAREYYKNYLGKVENLYLEVKNILEEEREEKIAINFKNYYKGIGILDHTVKDIVKKEIEKQKELIKVLTNTIKLTTREEKTIKLVITIEKEEKEKKERLKNFLIENNIKFERLC